MEGKDMIYPRFGFGTTGNRSETHQTKNSEQRQTSVVEFKYYYFIPWVILKFYWLTSVKLI